MHSDAVHHCSIHLYLPKNYLNLSEFYQQLLVSTKQTEPKNKKIALFTFTFKQCVRVASINKTAKMSEVLVQHLLGV